MVVNCLRPPDGAPAVKAMVWLGDNDMWNNLKKCLLVLTVAGVMVLSSGCTVDIYGDWPEEIIIDYWGGGHGHDIDIEYDD